MQPGTPIVLLGRVIDARDSGNVLLDVGSARFELPLTVLAGVMSTAEDVVRAVEQDTRQRQAAAEHAERIRPRLRVQPPAVLVPDPPRRRWRDRMFGP